MSTTPSGTPSPGGSSTSSSAQSANNLAGNSNNNPYQVEYPFKVLQEYCEKYLLQQQDQHHLGNQLLSGNHHHNHQPASKRAKLDTMNVKLEASRMAYLLQGQLQRQTVVVPKTEYSVPPYHQINYAHQQQQQQQQQSWFYHQQQQYLQQHQLFSSGQHIASGDNKQQQQLFSSGHQMAADAESKQQHQLFPSGQHIVDQSQQNYAAYSSNDHASNHASIATAQSRNLAGNSNSNPVIEVNDASDVNSAESEKEISTKISDPWTEPQESYNHNL